MWEIGFQGISNGMFSRALVHWSGAWVAERFPYWLGSLLVHDDVIKWKHFPRYWPFVQGIHRSPVNFPRKGQWRRALMFSLICVWINGWVNNGEAGDLRRHHAHCDVIVMWRGFRAWHLIDCWHNHQLLTGLKLENYYLFTFTFSRPEVRKLLLFYVFTFSRPEVRKLFHIYVFTFSRPEVGKLFHISMA